MKAPMESQTKSYKFNKSTPWINHNLYSHYIQTTRPSQTITTDTIASTESDLIGASLVTEIETKISKGGHPKGSTNKKKEEFTI